MQPPAQNDSELRTEQPGAEATGGAPLAPGGRGQLRLSLKSNMFRNVTEGHELDGLFGKSDEKRTLENGRKNQIDQENAVGGCGMN
jgi:hypothetical protein